MRRKQKAVGFGVCIATGFIHTANSGWLMATKCVLTRTATVTQFVMAGLGSNTSPKLKLGRNPLEKEFAIVYRNSC